MDADTRLKTEERIIAMLKTVYDPEIPVNIYDLGLIYKIDLQDNGAGGNFGVIGILVPLFNESLNRYGLFPADSFQKLSISDYNLHHRIHIPQINERHSAVIPDIFHPPGYPQCFSNILLIYLIQRDFSVTNTHDSHSFAADI